jgi:small multidrug resistance family-3 protein
MLVLKTAGLFVLTALAEILGCYLPYVWLRKNGSSWLLVPAGLSLMLFAWLLTLHPTAAVALGGIARPAAAICYIDREEKVNGISYCQ